MNADGHNLYLVDDQNQVSLFYTLYFVTYTRLLECMTPEFKAQQIWEQFVFLISEQSEIRNQNKKRTHLTLSKMTGFNDQVLFHFCKLQSWFIIVIREKIEILIFQYILFQDLKILLNKNHL